MRESAACLLDLSFAMAAMVRTRKKKREKEIFNEFAIEFNMNYAEI